MTFPDTPLQIITELMIDGTWTDVSGDVYNRDTLEITRGRPDEASSPDPSKLRLTLNNRDGKYTLRNPRSPLYGKIGRNTPIRVSVSPDGGASRYVRFEGEATSWPASWNTDGSDGWVSLEASGVTRRYGQGTKPMLSALRRRIASYSPMAYWPMEDREGSTEAFALSPGVAPADTPGWDYGQADGPGGSAPLAVIQEAGGLEARIPYYSLPSSGNTWCAEFVYRVPQAPSSEETLFRVRSDGSASLYNILVTPTGWRLSAYAVGPGESASASNELYNYSITAPSAFGTWNRLRFKLTQTGANTCKMEMLWIVINGSGTITSQTFSGTIGRISRVYDPAVADGFGGHSIGHLVVHNDDTAAMFDFADHGYNQEAGQTRLSRVAADAGIPLTIDAPGGMTAVGSQRPDTVMATLEAAATVDGGLLYEAREGRGLAYRSRTTLYNQPPALDISYGDVAPPLLPTDDDQATRNDVTVSNVQGSEYRVELTDGPMSVQDPPLGVGRYDTVVDVSAGYDDDLPPMAQWLAYLGTRPESRYPIVTIDLARCPQHIAEAATLDLWDRIRIGDPPAYLPPDPIDLLMEGYTERLSLTEWTIEINASPYTPWDVSGIDGRVDTDGSYLVTGIDADDISMLVAPSTDGPLWTTSASEFPFDVTMGGEQMAVTGIAPLTSDPFTRTVSSGWGSTPQGIAWLTFNTAASDYSVDGALGRHSVGSVNISRYTVLNATLADFDIAATVGTSALATGASQYANLVGRFTDPNNAYCARLGFGTDQSVTIQIDRRAGGTQTGLVNAVLSHLKHTPSARYWIRFRAVGSALYAKAWAMGGSEPDAWQISTTDTTHTVGGVGTRSILGSGNTNTLPVTVSYDSFTINSPQVFSVTRGTNNVAIPHPAGRDIRLAAPVVIAW